MISSNQENLQKIQADVHLKNGIDLAKINDYQGAIDELNKAIHLNSTPAFAHALRGFCYLETGNLENALRDCTQADIDSDYCSRYFWKHHTVEVFYAYKKVISNISDYLASNSKKEWVSNDIKELLYKAKTLLTELYLNFFNDFRMINENQRALTDANKLIALNPNNAKAHKLYADCLYDLRQIPAAIVSYNQALKLDPTDSFALLYRAHAFDKLNDYEHWLDDITKYMQMTPNHTPGITEWVEEVKQKHAMLLREQEKMLAENQEKSRQKIVTEKFEQAESLYQEKKYEGALSKAKEVLQLENNSAEAHKLCADCYYELGQITTAINWYKQAIKLDPNDVSTLLYCAYAVTKLDDHELGDIPAVLEPYNQAIALNPNKSQLYFSRALIFNKLKDYLQALNDINKVLELNPNDTGAKVFFEDIKKQQADVYLKRGIALEKTKDYNGALAQANEAIRLDPNCADAYLLRGNCYLETGEPKSALPDYTQAILLDPNGSTYYNRSIFYYELKDYPQALNDLTKALELDPNNTKAKTFKAKIHIRHGQNLKDEKDYLGAIVQANEALLLNPNDADAYFLRGYCYTETKEPQKALLDFTKAIDLNPANPLFYYNRAIFFDRMQDYPKAINDLKKYLTLSQNDTDKKNFLAKIYVNYGDELEKKKNYQNALVQLKEAIALDPNNPDAYLIMGFCYYSLLQIGKAIIAYDKAFALSANLSFPDSYRTMILDNIGLIQKYIATFYVFPNGYFKDPNSRGIHGRTLLHVAVGEGDLDLAKFFIAQGTVITPDDKNKWPHENELCSYVAQDPQRQLGYQECKKYIQSTLKLIAEVKKGDLQKVKDLIEQGADVRVIDKNGYTLLHHAANANYPEITEFLISKGLSVDNNTKTLSGTPLFLAAANNAVGAAEVLIKHGANINFKMVNDERTPLSVAEAKGHQNMVALLFSNSIELLDHAIESNSNVAELFILRGDCYSKKGEMEKALSDYHQATKLNPNDSSAYFKRAEIHHKQSNYEEALNELDKVLQLEPNNAEIKTLLKAVYYKTDKGFEELNHLIEKEKIIQANISADTSKNNKSHTNESGLKIGMEVNLSYKVNPTAQANVGTEPTTHLNHDKISSSQLLSNLEKQISEPKTNLTNNGKIAPKTSINLEFDHDEFKEHLFISDDPMHSPGVSNFSISKNETNTDTGKIFEYVHAGFSGVYATAMDYVNMVVHPIDNVLYPISILTYDAALIAAGYEYSNTFIQPTNPFYLPFRALQHLVAQKPQLYTDAVARMQARFDGLKAMGAQFLKASGPERVEMATHAITAVLAPGFIIKAAKVATNMFRFNIPHNPPRFTDIYGDTPIYPQGEIHLYSASEIQTTNLTGKFLYGITPNGKLLLARDYVLKNPATGTPTKTYIHHQEIGRLQELVAAGEADFIRGNTSLISNNSGRYCSWGEYLHLVVERTFIRHGFKDAKGKFKDNFSDTYIGFDPVKYEPVRLKPSLSSTLATSALLAITNEEMFANKMKKEFFEIMRELPDTTSPDIAENTRNSNSRTSTASIIDQLTNDQKNSDSSAVKSSKPENKIPSDSEKSDVVRLNKYAITASTSLKKKQEEKLTETYRVMHERDKKKAEADAKQSQPNIQVSTSFFAQGSWGGNSPRQVGNKMTSDGKALMNDVKKVVKGVEKAAKKIKKVGKKFRF